MTRDDSAVMPENVSTTSDAASNKALLIKTYSVYSQEISNRLMTFETSLDQFLFEKYRWQKYLTSCKAKFEYRKASLSQLDTNGRNRNSCSLPPTTMDLKCTRGGHEVPYCLRFHLILYFLWFFGLCNPIMVLATVYAIRIQGISLQRTTTGGPELSRRGIGG